MDTPLNPMPRERVRVPPPQFCECGDPGCPACQGHCHKPARTVVYRSDMEDETGTPMCDNCAADCMDSGLFYTKESVGYRVIDALINEEGATAVGLIKSLKPKPKKPLGPAIEPLKEPPGSAADLRLKTPPPKASFYPSNGGPSSV